MIINSLKIYGFGKLTDIELSFAEGINVIEGRNEAGKSTLMAFIKAVLFGFESRHHPHERYEPLTGGRFGGILYLTDQSGQKYSIERVFTQKASGDLLITLPSGETAGEELLPSIIGNINKSIFRQVFSFGLWELQQIEFLSDEQINDFIYHVGTGSVNQILEMKKEIGKKKSELYLASGAKPVINQQLATLEKLAGEIRELEMLIADYAEHQTEIENLTKLIANHEQELSLVEDNLSAREKYSQAYQAYLDLERADLALADYPADFNFPEAGVRRFEEAQQQVKRLKDQENELKERINSLSNQLVDLSSEQAIEEVASEILRLKSELVLYLENIRKEQLLVTQLEQSTRNINEQLRQLGGDYNLDTVQQFMMTIQEKDWLQNQYSELADIKSKVEEKTRDIERINLDEQETLNAISALQQEEERQTVKNPLLSEFPAISMYWTQLKEKGVEKRNKTEQLELFEEQQSLGRSSALLGNTLLLVLFIAVAGAIYYYSESFVAGAVAFLLGIVGIAIFNVSRVLERKNKAKVLINNSERLRSQLSTIISEEQDLLHSLDLSLARIGVQELTDATFYALEQRYNRDYTESLVRIGESKRIVEFENDLKNIVSRRELLVTAFNRENEKLMNLRASIETGLNAKGLPTNLNYNAVSSLIATIEKIKDEYYRKVERENELAVLNKFKSEYETSVSSLQNYVKISQNSSVEQFVNIVAERLQFYRDNLLKNQNINERLEEANNSLRQNTLAIQSDSETIAELLKSANASNVEEFYNLSRQFAAYTELVQQRKDAVLALKLLANSEKQYEQLIADLKMVEFEHNEMEIEELKTKRVGFKELIKDFSERKGALVASQNLIENNASLAELKLKYEQESAILHSLGKEWLSYAYSEALLDQTMQIYEEEKQPSILLTASELFSLLTGGEYIKIISTIGSNELRVLRKDNRKFEPQFLSRGTVEQLFLAIRYALVKEYSKQHLLPIILDDIFVNFDEERLDNAIEIVKDFANDQQVIIFTCHPRLTNRLKELDKNAYNIKLA